jgi:hypothetical protein
MSYRLYNDLLLPANLHWLEVPKPGKTWTLFTRGRTKDSGFWGFWANQETPEIVRHDIYLDMMRKKQYELHTAGDSMEKV